jgi:hypothetical protein
MRVSSFARTKSHCQWWFPAYLNHDLLAFAAGAKLRRPFGRIFGNGTAVKDKTEACGTMLLPLSGV